MSDSYNTLNIIKRLFREHIKQHLGKIIAAIFFMAIAAACTAIIVKLVQPTIDQVFLTHDRHMLVVLSVVTFCIFLIKGTAEYYQNYLVKYIGQMILTSLQIRMYQHLLYADLKLIESESSGRLISRFTNDISLMRNSVSQLLIGCAKHLLSVIFLIILMFKLEPVLSSFVFFVFPAALYPVQKIGRRMRKLSNEAQEELANYTAKLDETFHSIKIIKSFAMEYDETNRATKIAHKILAYYKRTAKLDAFTSPIIEILSGLAVGGIMWYGGLLVIENQTTPGALFAFITAFVSAYRPFKSLVSLNVNLQEGISAARRVFNMLDTTPTVHNLPQATATKFNIPNIIFQNIHLKFNSKIALKDINLELKTGYCYALIGRSGSGKSSLINLLIRFYDPIQGIVKIDDHDIRDLTLESLRQQIALVTQDTLLFDTSVRENILYGRKDASQKEVIRAAKYADAHGFITALPQGYDTIIGPQGLTLSGGQRQKITIARALIKDAPILVLDEATSALDPHSEANILKSLREIRKDKTTIIITHRLNSIKEVDQIIVMKNSQLLEIGSHQELLDKKNEYYKLYLKSINS